jgi:hypothetical protein
MISLRRLELTVSSRVHAPQIGLLAGYGINVYGVWFSGILFMTMLWSADDFGLPDT